MDRAGWLGARQRTRSAARPAPLRALAGVAIVAALGYRFGADPFVEGLRRTDAAALAVALGVTAATTWCCAARWRVLADRLEVGLPLGAAYRACYRAQLLNATLPGGVAGDVHRAYRHGSDRGALGRGLRSVAWDRAAGQVVQAAMAAVAVLLLPAAVRDPVLVVLGGALVLVLAVVALPVRAARALREEASRVLDRGGVLPVVLLSAAAAGGHVLVFVVAARTAGVTVPTRELVPLALVVLLASAVPLGVAGWGPREGAAAWAFAGAGLGGGTGLTVSVVYGVMALVATLPGVLVAPGGRRRLAASSRPAAPPGRGEVRHG